MVSLGTTLRALGASFLLLAGAGFADAADTRVTGRIVDPSGLPLPGVTVVLGTSAFASLTVTTSIDGQFAIEVPAGTYTLTAELAGFEPATRRLVVGELPVVADITLQLARLEAEVSVTARDDDRLVGETRPGAPTVVNREILENANLPSGNVLNVLALLPNVVRGPDGLISVAGARAPQGQLLVNGLTQNDPVLGTPTLMLPLDPVDSVKVLSHGYSTEFGRAR